jgi:ABC-2 type transport system permease protein
MKLREVFRLELGYQVRRPWTWVYFVALFAIILQITVEGYTANARSEGYFFNAPIVTATMTFAASFMGLLATAGFAGDAAARDVQTRMYPLLYTSSLGTGTFLAGRFLAALALNAFLLLAAPVALVVSILLPGIPKDLLGPVRPEDYLEAYLLLALPNALIATSLLFSAAVLIRRAIAGYLGAVVIFFAALSAWLLVAVRFGQWTLAKVLDPMALTVLSEISRTTTGTQKNSLSLTDFESLLVNRAIWLGVALAALAVTRARFRFEQPATRARWSWWRTAPTLRTASFAIASYEGPRDYAATPRGVVAPRSTRSFAFGTHLRQATAIASHAFREVALSWGGFVLAALTLMLVVFGPQALNHMDIPLIPTTQQMTSFLGNTGEIVWTIVPLLTVFYAGELVSRERETGLSEIADAAPAPDWARLLGKFAGLVLVFAAYQAMLMTAAMLIQARLGYFEFEPMLYLRIIFGLQLVDHVLFALLAITVHVIVDQKYVGYLVIVVALGFIMFATSMGIEHKLLIYGADTGWTYTDLRRFGPSIAPWLAFKLYWGTSAVLLAVVARLFWVRGRERGARVRLQTARARLTGRTLGVAAAAGALVVTLGSFVFYNTNVLNAYETTDDRTVRRVEYERLYTRYAGAAQPRLTRTTLRAEIYPSQHRAELRGTYRLVNMTGVPIDSIHVAPVRAAATGPVTFDRAATLVLNDSAHGHRSYELETPLAPGDSVQMSFTVRLAPRGFTNDGVIASVAHNGTFLDANDWLPAIGYQRTRELTDVAQRRERGLPPRARIRSLDDIAARMDMAGAERAVIETIVGTEAGQVAVAPGALEREWTEDGRRYFHYVTDAPIRNDFALFSAAYSVHEGQWRNPSDSTQTVEIQILHHPTHTKNPGRMIRSVQASLETLTRSLGPYPHRQVRLVEHPGNGGSLHAYPVNISFEEEFSLFDSDKDPRNVDFPFAVVAHEMAHQWWGGVVTPANVEGGALLSESLAWYSAMSVVEATYGTDHVDRLLAMFRDSYLDPRPAAAPPLLRAYDRFHAYRKGPFVMYALREYVGAGSIDAALGRFIRAHGTDDPPLPTSLDLYRELRAVTPDSLHPLLADLFEANTYWELRTKSIQSEEASAGTWRVTLDVTARKVVVDTAGFHTEVPMNDLVEVGVYAPSEGDTKEKPLYLRTHRIRAGDQEIVVTVPGRPGRGGLDPRHLLIDVEPNDNTRSVSRGQTIRFR